jgi:hypothetical protein
MTDILYFIGQPIIEKDHWVIRAETPRRRSDEVRIDPKRLEWQSWRRLTGTSEPPPPDLSAGRLFIETPNAPIATGMSAFVQTADGFLT